MLILLSLVYTEPLPSNATCFNLYWSGLPSVCLPFVREKIQFDKEQKRRRHGRIADLQRRRRKQRRVLSDTSSLYSSRPVHSSESLSYSCRMNRPRKRRDGLSYSMRTRPGFYVAIVKSC